MSQNGNIVCPINDLTSRKSTFGSQFTRRSSQNNQPRRSKQHISPSCLPLRPSCYFKESASRLRTRRAIFVHISERLVTMITAQRERAVVLCPLFDGHSHAVEAKTWGITSCQEALTVSTIFMTILGLQLPFSNRSFL